MSKYVKVDDLQAYCDNQADHSITPNVFQRMNHIEVVMCKHCKWNYNFRCIKHKDMMIQIPEWFCASGERRR